MRLSESAQGDVAIFALEGEIDLHYAPVLRALFKTKLHAKAPALVLDLGKVTYVDSTGLAAIIEYFRDSAEHGGVLCLAGLNDQLRTTFEIVRLDQTIPIFAKVDEAVAAFGRGELSCAPDDMLKKPVA